MKRTPLRRRTPLARTQALRLRASQGLAAGRRTAQRRSEGLKPASAKRQAQNRERAAVVRALFPPGEFHQCAVPGCNAEATDPHEPLTRARGGSITDPDNIIGLCRRHHNEIHSEPPWAYELGLLRHSWDSNGVA